MHMVKPTIQPLLPLTPYKLPGYSGVPTEPHHLMSVVALEFDREDRGERVLLWRYADTDQYYWTTLGMDDYLRKLETVVYAFSDTKDESVKVLTPDNAYYLEISTHKKLVTFSTAKSDGEPYAYTFQFDTAAGRVTLADDVGNYMELDSKNTSITLENADDSKVVLDRKVINISSVDAINLNIH